MSGTPAPRRRGAVVAGGVGVFAAVAVGALAPLVAVARSGHGDGFGDLLTIAVLLPGVPLLVVGTVLTTASAAGAGRAAPWGAGVAIVGTLVLLPLTDLRGPVPVLAVALAAVAALAGIVSAVLARRARPTARPADPPAPGPG